MTGSSCSGSWPLCLQGQQPSESTERLDAAQCQGEDSTGSPTTREHNRLCSVSTTGRDFRKSGFVVEDKLELR